MTRRSLLARLAWVPLLGPVLHRAATTVPQLPPVRQGVTFTKIGSGLSRDFPALAERLGPGSRYFPYRGADVGVGSVQAQPFLLSPAWRGWIENARGQVIAFVQRDWSVWGTP